jgi:hypothetical protein
MNGSNGISAWRAPLRSAATKPLFGHKKAQDTQKVLFGFFDHAPVRLSWSAKIFAPGQDSCGQQHRKPED